MDTVRLSDLQLKRFKEVFNRYFSTVFDTIMESIKASLQNTFVIIFFIKIFDVLANEYFLERIKIGVNALTFF